MSVLIGLTITYLVIAAAVYFFVDPVMPESGIIGLLWGPILAYVLIMMILATIGLLRAEENLDLDDDDFEIGPGMDDRYENH